MTRDELATLRARINRLFGAGDDDAEIQALFMQRAGSLDYERANAALSEYALSDGGPKRRFIPGKYLRFYDAQPEPRRVVLVDREKAAREAALVEARRAEEIIAQREQRDSDRRTVLSANPLIVGEIVDELVSWGAPRPPLRPESWPRAWILAVADLLLDRSRAAPSPEGYYEQVRDERGQLRDDPTRPLNPMCARDWWRLHGARGLAAYGHLTAAAPS